MAKLSLLNKNNHLKIKIDLNSWHEKQKTFQSRNQLNKNQSHHKSTHQRQRYSNLKRNQKSKLNQLFHAKYQQHLQLKPELAHRLWLFRIREILSLQKARLQLRKSINFRLMIAQSWINLSTRLITSRKTLDRTRLREKLKTWAAKKILEKRKEQIITLTIIEILNLT